MKIANPIYDVVFKYLMEDERIARTILSALLKKDVVKVDMRAHEYSNDEREYEDNGMGHVIHYVASETDHSYSGTSVGRNYESYNVGLKATIETPLPWIEGGDSLVFHTTIKRTSSPYAYAYIHVDTRLTFEDESIGMNFSSDWAVWGEVRNLKGSTTVGISPDDPDSGEWDYVIHIPSGSKKNELRALNFNACGGRTHWVYRWCSIFEKGEL